MIIHVPHFLHYWYTFSVPSLSKIADNLDVPQSDNGLTFVVPVIGTGGSVMLLAFAEMFGGFVVWNVLLHTLSSG